MSNKKKLRKQVFVSKAIQGRLTLRLCRYWVLNYLFTFAVLFAHYCLTQSNLVRGARPEPFGPLLERFFSDYFIVLVLVGLAVLPGVCWDMVKLSHKVAGPLVRFERACLAMANGERQERLELRPGDLLHDFADVFNQLVDAHNARMAAAASGGDPKSTARPTAPEAAAPPQVWQHSERAASAPEPEALLV
jgi:hypothetical protein